jgi:hypothetical protein
MIKVFSDLIDLLGASAWLELADDRKSKKIKSEIKNY